MKPLIAIPAAGGSSRMRGRDKLLEQVDDLPLLRRQASFAIATGCPVTVLLPPNNTARREVVSDLDVSVVEVVRHEEGLSATLQAAVGSLNAPQPLMVLLPDVPGVTTEEIHSVLSEFANCNQSRIVRASDPEGLPGTPIVFPWDETRKFSKLSGDRGWKPDNPLLVSFRDNRATLDLDTPEDWAAWRLKKSAAEDRSE